jgi:chorismate synthase
MGGTFGEGLKLSIFGESHGALIGIVINNMPSALSLIWIL